MSDITTSEYNYRLPNGQIGPTWHNQLSGAQSAVAKARMALESAGAVNQKIEILHRTVTVSYSETTVHSEVWANPIPEELPTPEPLPEEPVVAVDEPTA